MDVKKRYPTWQFLLLIVLMVILLSSLGKLGRWMNQPVGGADPAAAYVGRIRQKLGDRWACAYQRSIDTYGYDAVMAVDVKAAAHQLPDDDPIFRAFLANYTACGEQGTI